MDSKKTKINKRTHASSSTEIRELDRGEEVITDANRDTTNRHDVRTETENSDTATLQHTGSVCVKIRSSRAAPVCLVLLCVLLLTAVIVLAIKLSKTVDEFYIKYKNITEEIDELRRKKSILNENITNLSSNNETLHITKWTLQNETEELREEIHKMAGWSCYQSSLYYISNKTKSWNESRRYCTERGADLIIINNKEKQDFVNNMSGAAVVWIGLTDSDVEGRWKWVDGSTLTSGFWASNEPKGGRAENCAVTVPKLAKRPGLVGWLDVACDKAYQWICERKISELILP